MVFLYPSGMNARWKFRTIDHNYTRRVIRNGRLPLEIVGADIDALSMVGHLVRREIESGTIQRIEVESVGPVNAPEDSSTERLICTIRQRADGRGWSIEANDLQHLCWQLTLIDALSYGAFRTRGKLAEFRVLNRQGRLLQIVLIDQRRWEDGLAFPRAADAAGSSG